MFVMLPSGSLLKRERRASVWVQRPGKHIGNVELFRERGANSRNNREPIDCQDYEIFSWIMFAHSRAFCALVSASFKGARNPISPEKVLPARASFIFVNALPSLPP